jgi:hypothetical protein
VFGGTLDLELVNCSADIVVAAFLNERVATIIEMAKAIRVERQRLDPQPLFVCSPLQDREMLSMYGRDHDVYLRLKLAG